MADLLSWSLETSILVECKLSFFPKVIILSACGFKNFDLGKGDAVFYKGCEVPHMRKPYDGDWYVQIFLHYVNADGPNKEWLRDKRQHWGIVKN